MKDRYIVYIRNTSVKLYESESLDACERFISRLEYDKRMNGDFEGERYEIIRGIKR